ncbi:MAG: type II toxin-antitoxin system PemK/MazF family toxin [Chloroflexi bacterium]|nr:type II toxin-antitoxin system PemK/MazF family toxin [Chloroflexota bacterium]
MNVDAGGRQPPQVRRGQIWWVDFNPARGSEQQGMRPALVVQNDIGNEVSPTTIVIALTTNVRRVFPFTVLIPSSASGLPQDSLANAAQILTVDKTRLRNRVGQVADSMLSEIDRALAVSLGMPMPE